MSIFRTLKQRGHDPIGTMIETVQTDITTGQLPPRPSPKSTSNR